MHHTRVETLTAAPAASTATLTANPTQPHDREARRGGSDDDAGAGTGSDGGAVLGACRSLLRSPPRSPVSPRSQSLPRATAALWSPGRSCPRASSTSSRRLQRERAVPVGVAVRGPKIAWCSISTRCRAATAPSRAARLRRGAASTCTAHRLSDTTL